MPELDFITVDVFTDRKFAGNPLAVFPAPTELSGETMQKLARELNLSETVFVRPGDGLKARRLRIFTPAREVPFAGHPIIGTAIVLANEGLLGEIEGATEILFEVEAGVVPVKIKQLGELLHAEFTAPQLPREVQGTPSREILARVIGLDEDRLARGVAGASHSCGLPFIFVPVADRAALAEARIDPVAFERHVARGPAKEVYVLTMEDWQLGREVYARMFAPAAGIIEDPATGSAAAACAGFLSAIQEPGEGIARWTIAQGVEMGRPSLISLSARIEGGKIQSVEVGGSAVIVSRGSFFV